VTKFNAAGSALIYSTYLGGTGHESGEGIAVDSAGSAYVTGITWSTDFPTKNPVQGTFGGGRWDGFVAKIALTFLQGSGSPRPGAAVNLTLTTTNDVGLGYVLGSSFSTGPIKIDTRTLGLGVDKLLEVSVGGVLPTVFVGYQGVISANGQATAKINLPNIAALVGQRIHTAFVTVSSKAAHGIKSISNTFSFTITK